MLKAMGLGDWPATAQEPAEAAAAVPMATAEGRVPRLATLPAAVEVALPVPRAASPQGRDWADLEAVHASVRDCQACGLCRQRKQAVPGVGHAHAEWMVVGEAPGEQEDERGEPFVGASGQLLDAMLAAVGLGRQPGTPQQQVFIANTVKCRPPGNRNPTHEEVAACSGFLQAQIALVKPRLILALGRIAAQSLLGDDSPVGRLRGRAHFLPDGTPVVVSYHPSYLLRQPLEKARAWEDLCLAADMVETKGQAA